VSKTASGKMRAISTAVLKLTDMLQKQRRGCEGRD